MTDEAMSPLRRRMIEDMTIRKLSPKTQQGYIRTIKNFSSFPRPVARHGELRGHPALSAAAGHERRRHANSSIKRWRRCGSFSGSRSSDLPSSSTRPFIHEPRKLPVVLSPEEVARLLDAAPGLKYKAALSVAYGAGLRAAEVVSLKVGDIDSKRMVIRVEQGKGRKDRNVMLSPHLLELLRAWWKAARAAGLAVSRSEPGEPSHAPASSTVPAMPQPIWPTSRSVSPCTRCGTALPPICSSRTSISE